MRDTDSEQTHFLPEETCTASGAAHQLNSFPWALWRASAATDLAWVSPTERKPNNQFLASCKRLKDYRIHKNTTSAYREKKCKCFARYWWTLKHRASQETVFEEIILLFYLFPSNLDERNPVSLLAHSHVCTLPPPLTLSDVHTVVRRKRFHLLLLSEDCFKLPPHLDRQQLRFRPII